MSRPSTRRSTSSANARGSAAARRARKQWLLDTFGDGTTAPCVFCGRPCTFETVSPDRIIPGCEGGTYAHENIQPAHVGCNVSAGGKLGAARREANEPELWRLALPSGLRRDPGLALPLARG